MSYSVESQMFTAVAARSLCGIKVDDGVKSSKASGFEEIIHDKMFKFYTQENMDWGTEKNHYDQYHITYFWTRIEQIEYHIKSR